MPLRHGVSFPTTWARPAARLTSVNSKGSVSVQRLSFKRPFLLLLSLLELWHCHKDKPGWPAGGWGTTWERAESSQLSYPHKESNRPVADCRPRSEGLRTPQGALKLRRNNALLCWSHQVLGQSVNAANLMCTIDTFNFSTSRWSKGTIVLTSLKEIH